MAGTDLPMTGRPVISRMKLDHACPSTDHSMTGRPFAPNDEDRPLLPQHRTANERAGHTRISTDPSRLAAPLRVLFQQLVSVSFSPRIIEDLTPFPAHRYAYPRTDAAGIFFVRSVNSAMLSLPMVKQSTQS